MSPASFRLLALIALLAPGLAAWSPRVHEAQTTLAMKLAPRRMAAILKANQVELVRGARGQASDQVPTVEEVEEQFQRIVTLTENKRRSAQVVYELGVLAHKVQLLMDPSALVGGSPLRDSFEAYADEKLNRLVLAREPFWAVSAPLDPRPHLLEWAKRKFERHQVLAEGFDDRTGRRVGSWDELSIPYALLQLSYSNGINATVNLWIQLWRAVGDQWDPEAAAPPTPAQ